MRANQKPTGCWTFHSSTSQVTLAMKPDTKTHSQHSTKRLCLGKFWGLGATGIWLWEATESRKLWGWVFSCCYTDGHWLQAQGSAPGPNSHPLLHREFQSWGSSRLSLAAPTRQAAPLHCCLPAWLEPPGHAWRHSLSYCPIPWTAELVKLQKAPMALYTVTEPCSFFIAVKPWILVP